MRSLYSRTFGKEEKRRESDRMRRESNERRKETGVLNRNKKKRIPILICGEICARELCAREVDKVEPLLLQRLHVHTGQVRPAELKDETLW